MNHRGEVAVFYSARHGHGTALGDAGVPEKDISASMHHASRTTTARYLHANDKSRTAAIATLPDLSYPQAQIATGTDGKAADCLRNRGDASGLRWTKAGRGGCTPRQSAEKCGFPG